MNELPDREEQCMNLLHISQPDIVCKMSFYVKFLSLVDHWWKNQQGVIFGFYCDLTGNQPGYRYVTVLQNRSFPVIIGHSQS